MPIVHIVGSSRHRRCDSLAPLGNGAFFFSANAPFGGDKQSGIGREMGVEGFKEYLETKTIAVPVDFAATNLAVAHSA
ncbi:MAG TPA: aldehyde dehydrogenase family protein [Vicinamibacterales bacterium]|nr:aldehyde dehydrogenase family protein [Vicinamibacterales bacterium]